MSSQHRVWLPTLVTLALACSSKAVEPVPRAALAPPPASQPKPAPPAEPAPPPELPIRPALPQVAGLHYVERILGAADPESPLPMLVVIHGLGDTPENFATLFDERLGPARLVAFQAVAPEPGGGFSWFPKRARDPDVQGLSEGIAASAEAIAVAVRALMRTRPTAGEPVVTGFSQGGMLTFALAAQHPDVVGSAVAVGGWLPPPLQPREPAPADAPPLVALHGTADRAVLYEPTRQAVEHLQSLGYPVRLLSYPDVPHVITPPMRDELHTQLLAALRRETASRAP